MWKVLLVDWDNYLSRIFFINKVVIQKEPGEKIDLLSTLDKSLKIFTYFNNLLKYKTYSEIIFIFDTPTWKDANIKILADIIEKFWLGWEWYKWKRTKRPEFNKFKKIFQNLLYFQWFKIMSSTKFEADDVIGTLAKRHEALDDTVHILSKDNDLFQLLSDNIHIVDGISKDHIENPFTRGKMKLKFLSQKWVRIDTSEDIVYLKAIVWDKSDNIPWVKGIAEKTLAKSMWDTLKIIETDIYMKHKELIDAFVPLIELNTNIHDDDIKVLHIPQDLWKYNGYLLQILNELESELNNIT